MASAKAFASLLTVTLPPSAALSVEVEVFVSVSVEGSAESPPSKDRASCCRRLSPAVLDVSALGSVIAPPCVPGSTVPGPFAFARLLEPLPHFPQGFPEGLALCGQVRVVFVQHGRSRMAQEGGDLGIRNWAAII